MEKDPWRNRGRKWKGRGKTRKHLIGKITDVEAVFLFLQDMQKRERLCLPRPFLLRACTRTRSTGVSKIDTSEGAIFAFIFPPFYSCSPLFPVSLLFSGGPPLRSVLHYSPPSSPPPPIPTGNASLKNSPRPGSPERRVPR